MASLRRRGNEAIAVRQPVVVFFGRLDFELHISLGAFVVVVDVVATSVVLLRNRGSRAFPGKYVARWFGCVGGRHPTPPPLSARPRYEDGASEGRT